MKIRTRFAPSPTGPLHIGGVRTALYDYLFTRKNEGTFVLRIEDTDRLRFVKGAEAYIIEALNWCGIIPDEGPGFGGNFGPYRQSERREIYDLHIKKLLEGGHAYYAFDTPEELEAMRTAMAEKGRRAPRYDYEVRDQMKNSLTMPQSEVDKRLRAGDSHTIRLKVQPGETVTFSDEIRGEVRFDSVALDDKILVKSDGMPTYHLANVVDDRLMEISHVIRGEEWISSTPHHVLLYRYLGWSADMPQFAHLPLILKPSGKGKLSKRDSEKLGIPIFPLEWKDPDSGETYPGFREMGFTPEAVINFLALLGWNPGTEQELFNLEGLVEVFDLAQVGKAGARFDFEKAKWFNQQYITQKSNDHLVEKAKDLLNGTALPDSFLQEYVELMRDRITLYPDLLDEIPVFTEEVQAYDEKAVAKRWNVDSRKHFGVLTTLLAELSEFDYNAIQKVVRAYIQAEGLKFGQIMPLLRVAISGRAQGPDLFKIIELLGKEETHNRLLNAQSKFDEIIS